MTDGKHYDGFKYRNRRVKSHSGRNSLLGTALTALVGTVIKDLTSEDSKIRKLFNKVIHPKQIEDKQSEKKVINAEYSIVDDENKK